jgi:hypothetical protein
VNAAAAVAMYQRRGSVVGWQHATPISAQYVDEFTQGPKASLGASPPDGLTTGAFGETYCESYGIRAYVSSKVSNALLQQFGMIEAGDQELCVCLPFTPEPHYGIVQLPKHLLKAYNEGEFAQIAKSKTLIAVDRFTIFGRLWAAKGVPVPIVDTNTILAWRILTTKVTN